MTTPDNDKFFDIDFSPLFSPITKDTPLGDPIRKALELDYLNQRATNPDERPEEIKNLGYDLSKYTDYLGENIDVNAWNQEYDTGINEARAQRQSGIEQLTHGIVKGTGLAATTFLTTFTSLPYGILAAATTDDPSKIFDNPISRKYDEFNKAMEEWFPNFYTEQEQNAGAFSPDNWFTMNFLADKFLKNAGFTVGAIVSGAQIAKIGQALGKLAMGGKYAEELAAVTKLNAKYLEEGMKASKALSKSLEEVGKGIKLTNQLTRAGAVLFAAGSEGSIEALGTKQATAAKIEADLLRQFKENEISEEEYFEKLAKVESYASAAGNLDFVANLAILSVSDIIQFNKYLTGRKSLAKSMSKEAEELSENIIRKGGKYAAKEGIKYSTLPAKVSIWGKSLVTETAEEGSQFFSEKLSEDFYSKKFNNEGKASIADLIMSAGYALEETFGSKEGLESMLLGGLTGFISGGVTGETRRALKELKTKDKNLASIVERINKETITSVFEKNTDKIDNAVRSATLQAQIETALKEKNIFEYKNLKHDLFKSFVLSRLNAGKVETLMEEIDDLKHLPKEEFEQLIGIDPSTNTKTVNDFVNLLKKEVTRLNELHSNLEFRFPELSNGAREILFDYASNIDNTIKRSEEIQKELMQASDVFSVLKTYMENKTPEGKKLLDEVVAKESEKFDKDGNNLKELVDDYIKLNDRRTEFAEKYKEAITEPGKQKLNKKDADTLKKEAADRVRNERQSKFKDGTIVIDKKTGKVKRKLEKVGEEWRLYDLDILPDGSIGTKDDAKYTIVDPLSDDFNDLYDIETPEEAPEKVVKTRIFKDKKTGKVVTITPNKRKEGLYDVRDGNNIYELSAEKIADNYSFEIEEVSSQQYRHTKTNEPIVVVRDVPRGNQEIGSLFIKKAIHYPGKTEYKYIPITKKELDDNYTFIKVFEKETGKKARILAIETIIKGLEYKISALESELHTMTPIYLIQKEIEELWNSIKKGRDSKNQFISIPKIVAKIDELNKDIESKIDKTAELEKEITDLRKEYEFFKDRISEVESGEYKNVKEKGEEIVKKIQENEELITYFKKAIYKLKEIVDEILSLLGIKRLYGTLDLSKKNEKDKQYIKNALKDAETRLKRANNPVALGSKINRLNKYIEEYEKINDELTNHLIYLKKEADLFTATYRELKMARNVAPIIDISSLGSSADSIENTDTLPKHDGESRKRSLKLVGFHGLVSRHRNDDGTLVDNPVARAYHRFMSKVKIEKGKYFVKIVKGGEVWDKYKEPADKVELRAYIVDKDGNFLNDKGEIVSQEEGIYAHIPTSQGDPNSQYKRFFKPKDQSEKEFHKELKEAEEIQLAAREGMIEWLDSGKDIILPIIGKSRGIARTTLEEFGEATYNPIDEVIPDENFDIVVATSDTMPDKFGMNVKVTPGFTYAVHRETGQIYPLKGRKLDTKEINLVVNLLRMFISQHNTNTGKLLRPISSEGASKLMVKDADGNIVPLLGEDGKVHTIFEVLEKLIYWTGDNLTAEAVSAIKAGKLTKEEAFADEKYWKIKKDSKTGLHFVPSEKPGGEIRINGNTPMALFVKDEKGNYIENPAIKHQLPQLLADNFINISASVNTNGKFFDIKAIKEEDGKFFIEYGNNPEYEKSGGYSKWLIDNKVLTSSAIKEGTPSKQEGMVGEEVPQFSSIYAIISHETADKDEKEEPKEKASEQFKKKAKEAIEKAKDAQKEGSETSSEEVTTKKSKLHLVNNEKNETSDEKDYGKKYGKNKEKNKDDDDINYTRRALAENIPEEEQIKVDKAIKWLEDTFGGRIQVGVLKHLIDGENWGTYRHKLIYLYERAGTGTEYHEAFHAVMDLFLNNRQYKALLNEYRERNNKKELSDSAVEELLAEDFTDFMLGKEISYFNSPRQRSLFKTILDFIKKVVLGEEKIQGIFANIKSGKYAKSKIKGSNHSKSILKSRNRPAIDGLNIKETSDMLDSINSKFFAVIFGTDEGVASLFDKESNSIIINNAYQRTYNSIRKRAFTIWEEAEELEKTDDPTVLKKMKVLDSTLENFETFKQLHKEYLKKYNLEFSEDEWNKDIPEEYRHKDSGNTWAFESMKYSAKINASKNIKLLIASIPVMDNSVTPVFNEYGLEIPLDFSKAFSTLINKLSNLTDWDDMQNTLEELANYNPWIKVLLKRLGTTKDINELSTSEFSLRAQFQQTMAKNENIFLMDIVESDGNTVVFNANQNTFVKRQQKRWEENAKRLASTSAKLLKTTPNGQIAHNKGKIDKMNTIDSVKEALTFLEHNGIVFSNKDKVEDKYEKRVVTLANGILQTIKKGHDEIFIFNENNYQNLIDLATIEQDTTVDNIENSFFNGNGDLIYGNTLNSYITLIINEINNSNITNIDELFKKLPHLSAIRNSLFLKRLFENKEKLKIEMTYYDSSKQDGFGGSVKSFSDLKPADQFRIRFMQTLQGNFNLLRPADNSQERFINFGTTFFDFGDINRRNHIKAFVNYLVAELEENRDLLIDNDQFSFVAGNINHGIVLDMIKSVDEKLYNDLISLIESGKDISKYIESKNSSVTAAINQYIKNQVQANIDIAVKEGLLIEGNEIFYSYGLQGLERKTNIEAIQSKMTLYTINSLVGNIEQVKLFLGNPVFFKNIPELFKRTSATVGTKKISIVSSYMNNWISSFLDDFSKNFGTTEGYFKQVYDSKGNPVIRTSIFSDLKTISRHLEEYKKLLGEDVANGYVGTTEGDAYGVVHIAEYRRMLIRSGDWTFGKGSLEEAYQYRMGYPNYTDPRNKETFEFDMKRIQKVVFNPLKPQYFGPLVASFSEGNAKFVPSLYKLSLTPLFPESVKKFPVLKQLVNQMEMQSVGIAVFQSGNKIGTRLNKEGRVQEVYDEEGNFNFSAKNQMITQDTYYKYWGIQVDMGNKNKNKVVWGTQMLKQLINNLYENGSIKNPGLEKLVTRYLRLNEKRIKLGYNELVEKLGLILEDDVYKVSNPAEFINTLKDEAISRELPDNIIDAIDDIAATGIDTYPNRRKIEQVLMAIAEKSVISQKTYGAGFVQIASTFTEQSARNSITVTEGKNKKKYLTSNELDFYTLETDKDGNIVRVKSMEVYLPDIYKGRVKIGEKVDKNLLRLLGFRIPTQGLNSIESIVVKGFVDSSMGDVIILPTDIVAKAGSDFDIDKLSVYLPHVFYDEYNNPRYIGSDISYAAYEKIQLNKIDTLFDSGILRDIKPDKTIKKLFYKALGQYKFGMMSFYGIEDIIDELETIVNEGGATSENAQKIIDILNKAETKKALSLERILSKTEYEKYQVENTLTNVMHDIVTHPDNAEQLLTPNTAEPLKNEATNIEYLEAKRDGYKGTLAEFKEEQRKKIVPFNSIVETEYLLELSRIFLGANTAIGITALHSTFHILSQLHGLFINDTYKKKIVKEFKNTLDTRSTRVNLEHNTTNGKPALGFTKAKDGNSIVQALSMWINAAVDAAKDPFMFKLNANPQTLNTILYLTMIGVPRRTISLFITQPIIKEYLQNQNKFESIVANATGSFDNLRYQDQIIEFTSKSFAGQGIKGIEDTVQLTEAQLEKALLDNGSDGKLQQQILYDFIRYQDTAKYISKAIQGTTYDTKGAGKSSAEMQYRLLLTERVLVDNVIGNYEECVNGTKDNSSFISAYHDSVKILPKVIETYIPTVKNENLTKLFKGYINKFLNPLVTLAEKDIIEILEKFKEDFITYLIMTRVSTEDKGSKKVLNTELTRLFKGDGTTKSMAHRTQGMKNKYSTNILLDNLLPIFATNVKEGINNIKMYATRVDNLESNQLTESWDELFNGDAEDRKYAEDLMKLVILQSGLQNGPMNFINFIPYTQYNKLIRGILNVLNNSNDTFLDFIPQFEIHNKHITGVIPSIKTEGFEFYKTKDRSKISGRVIGETIRDYEKDNPVKIENGPIRDLKNNSTMQAYGVMRILGKSNTISKLENTQVEDRSKKNQSTTTFSQTEQIYLQLGNKTASGNVVIKSVYQQEGIAYAKSIGGVFSLRVDNSEKHFGNPFSSVPAEIAKGLIATKSTKESVEKYIDWVINSQDERAKWIRKQLQSGVLKGKPIVYYKELGEPSHATVLDYLINKYDWNTNSITKKDINELPDCI